MKVGMLWFDAEPGVPLVSRLARAVEYYRQKYGEQPNLCLMHPGVDWGAAECSLQGLRLRTHRSVLPNHFWIGVSQPGAAAA